MSRTLGMSVLAAWCLVACLSPLARANEPGSPNGESDCTEFAVKDIRLGTTVDEAMAAQPGAKLQRFKRLEKAYGTGKVWILKRDYLKKKAADPVFVTLYLDKPDGRVEAITTTYTSYGGMTQAVAARVPNEVLLSAFKERYGEPSEERPFTLTDQRWALETVTTKIEAQVYGWRREDCGLLLELRLGQRESTVGQSTFTGSQGIYPVQEATLSTIEWKERTEGAQRGKVKL